MSDGLVVGWLVDLGMEVGLRVKTWVLFACVVGVLAVIRRPSPTPDPLLPLLSSSSPFSLLLFSLSYSGMVFRVFR